jgi:hypothetical protein
MLDTDNYDLTADDYEIDEGILDEATSYEVVSSKKNRIEKSPSYDNNDYEADYHDDDFESSIGETSPVNNNSGIRSKKELLSSK